MKRRMPKIIGVTTTLVLLAALGAGGFVWWKTSLPPVEPDIERFNDFARSLQPEGEDAWPRFEALVRDRLGVDLSSDDPWASERAKAFLRAPFDDALQGAFADERTRAAMDDLAQYADVLPMLDAIADAPAFFMPFTASDDVATVADAFDARSRWLLSVGLRPSSLNAAAMRNAAERGNWDEVERRLVTGVRFGRHLGRTPLMATRSIGGSFEAMAWSELATILTERTPPRAAIERLLRTYEHLGEPPTMADALEGERIAARGFLAYNLLSTRSEFDWFDPSTWSEWFSAPSPREVERAWRTYFDAMLPLIDRPAGERAAARPPAPPAVLDASWGVDPFDLFIDGHEGAVRRRASVPILLHLNRAMLDADGAPIDPLEVVPAELRTDPLYGGEFVVEPAPKRRLPFILRWPRPSNFGDDEVYFVRKEHDSR